MLSASSSSQNINMNTILNIPNCLRILKFHWSEIILIIVLSSDNSQFILSVFASIFLSGNSWHNRQKNNINYCGIGILVVPRLPTQFKTFTSLWERCDVVTSTYRFISLLHPGRKPDEGGLLADISLTLDSRSAMSRLKILTQSFQSIAHDRSLQYRLADVGLQYIPSFALVVQTCILLIV